MRKIAPQSLLQRLQELHQGAALGLQRVRRKQWRAQANGSLLNPQSGRCLDVPQGSTANGTDLQIYDCNALWTPVWTLPGSPTGPIVGPGTAAMCVDVDTNTATNGNLVQLWDCTGVPGQQWAMHADGTVRSFGKCLGVVGNATADGSKIQLWDCSGASGQTWAPQANGALLNPQSGRRMDAPSGVTTRGTDLQIHCNGSVAQQWRTAV